VTIDEAKKIIENDQYLLGLIRAKALKGMTFENLWLDLNKAEFRFYFESKYGLSLFDRKFVMGKVKDAIRLILQELKQEG
jgi:hypothetical protein